MPVTLSPEEQALLDGIPDDPNAQQPAEAAAPEASPDMGLIGGALNAMGLWDPPPAGNIASTIGGPEAAVAQKDAQRSKVQEARNSGPLGAVNSVLGAPLDAIGGTIGGGALKGVFETKDFLFGDTPASQQSDFRYNVEQDVKDDAEQSIFNGVAASLGQFTVGMLGAGKVAGAAKLLPLAGDAIKALKVGKGVASSAQAALGGFMAFDPHEERLSNAIQGTFLANPINDWLSAKDEDGVYEGRLKNALESIGMDATLGAAFLAAGRIYKAGKGLIPGGPAKMQELVDDFEANQARQLEEEANRNADNELAALGPNQSPTAEVNGQANTPIDFVNADGGGEGTGPITPADGTPGGSPEGGPQATPQAQEPSAGGQQGQAGTPGGSLGDMGVADRAPITAANDNAGAASSLTPEGGPGSINVKVRPELLNPVDPNGNGFGVPKRATRMTNPTPYIRYGDENTARVMELSAKDAKAIEDHGGFYEAIEAGHKFGDAANEVPYHKFTTQAEVDNFIARAVDVGREQLDDLKGGEVMSDARVDTTVKNMVKLTGIDPGFILGKIQQSGRLAPQLVADMETGFTLAQKTFADVVALNERYAIGDASGYASKEHMWEDIQHRLAVASSLYGAARSIMANSGRAMRRMRREFMFDPSKFKDVDPGKLSAIISKTGGRPEALKRLVDQRSIAALAGDLFQFLRLAGLISGPVTQITNALTSSYAAAMRPMERLLGSTALIAIKPSEALGQMGRDLRQYHAMGLNALSGFKDAANSFMLNDSILSPHTNEAQKMTMAPGAQPLDGNFFRYRATDGGDHTAINNMAYNAMSVAGGAASIPTRLLGSVDELIKQNTYRSYVMSRASQKAALDGASKGLKGKALKDYIKSEVESAMDAAFDSAGAGTDPRALKEAQMATFQQDLGATGKKVQGLASANWVTRFILPFVKTPTNIIKYGARLTPGLNLVMKEVREEILGMHGTERQAQATGQMMMGGLYMSAAAYLVSQGRFTGGGPSDPAARKVLTDQGWRPYSFVGEGEDGKPVYYQANRLDPMVMPMGIIADLQDHFSSTEWDGNDDSLSTVAMETMAGLGVALSRQFVNKSYLVGASQFLDAVSDPDKKGGRWVASAAASLVPFSSLTRQLDSDEYMKDAVSLSDAMRSVTPGMGEGVPHRRDWLGQKVEAQRGIDSWLGQKVAGKDSAIEAEARRIALKTGEAFGKVSPTQKGVDLRNIKLPDGLTAYEKLQDLTVNPRPSGGGDTLQQALNKLVNKPAYQKLPDGPATVEGTKSAAISNILSQYRKGAWNALLKKEPQVREAYKTSEQKAADRFRQLRGQPLRVEPDQNTIDHLLDAFGLASEDNQ